MEPVHFTFTPTGKEYAAAVQAFAMRRPGNPFLTGLFTVIGLVGIGAAVARGGAGTAWVALGPLLLLLLFLFLVRPWMIRRQVDKNERLRQPTSWELTEEEIRLRNPTAESRFDWGTFSRFIETKSFFLLVHSASGNLFHYVPKRAFATQEEETRFRDLLTRKLSS